MGTVTNISKNPNGREPRRKKLLWAFIYPAAKRMALTVYFESRIKQIKGLRGSLPELDFEFMSCFPTVFSYLKAVEN